MLYNFVRVHLSLIQRSLFYQFKRCVFRSIYFRPCHQKSRSSTVLSSQKIPRHVSGFNSRTLIKLSKIKPKTSFQAFPEHWSNDICEKQLNEGRIVACTVDVEKYLNENTVTAFGKSSDLPGSVFFTHPLHLNRALHGDKVAVFLHQPFHWLLRVSGGQYCRIGTISKAKLDKQSLDALNSVLKLLEEFGGEMHALTANQLASMTHKLADLSEFERPSLLLVGSVVAILDAIPPPTSILGRVMQQGDGSWLLQHELMHLPPLRVQVDQLPFEWHHNPDILVRAELDKKLPWPVSEKLPAVQRLVNLADVSQIELATQKLLFDLGIEERPFGAAVEAELCNLVENAKLNIENRRDFRQECVFSIDPSSARDLDDALHIRILNNDIIEVGVHIADVSHYVPANSLLDKEAARRSTTVYLVQRALPMLPAPLSEDLCSLHPGSDKATFSVIFHMDASLSTTLPSIKDIWFGRGVIRSCARLSYQDAQCLLDNEYESVSTDVFVHSPFTLSDVHKSVRQLHRVAQQLRTMRMQQGALIGIDLMELQFVLNEAQNGGVPLGMQVKKYGASNELVEEFMLLANTAVARRLTEELPEHAVLRRHEAPKSEKLKKLVHVAAHVGFKLKSQSAADLAKSIHKVRKKDSLLAETMAFLLYCNMSQAKYFCASEVPTTDWSHYGLNTAMYTHFTSPIRRYTDLLVHRQLSHLIEGEASTPRVVATDTKLREACNHANVQRMLARRASWKSQDIFMAAYIKDAGGIHSQACITNLTKDRATLFFPNLGLTVRSKLKSLVPKRSVDIRKKFDTSKWFWNATESCSHGVTQCIRVLSKLDCFLEVSDSLFDVRVTVLRPPCSRCANTPNSSLTNAKNDAVMLSRSAAVDNLNHQQDDNHHLGCHANSPHFERPDFSPHVNLKRDDFERQSAIDYLVSLLSFEVSEANSTSSADCDECYGDLFPIEHYAVQLLPSVACCCKDQDDEDFIASYAVESKTFEDFYSRLRIKTPPPPPPPPDEHVSPPHYLSTAQSFIGPRSRSSNLKAQFNEVVHLIRRNQTKQFDGSYRESVATSVV